jgi:hypothetical protein
MSKSTIRYEEHSGAREHQVENSYCSTLFSVGQLKIEFEELILFLRIQYVPTLILDPGVSYFNCGFS